ncbi:MAG: mandelate racemase/muconate lactonizing enzyme family protein [Alphaproteobacteria bacterium]|nr:mandelate racemase/muconate lactonizing enzyme family protein [Alphaproteobacteria bacterium]
MKITDIKAAVYRWPRRRPITNGKHTYTHAGVCLVTVETDEGVAGIGVGADKPLVQAAVEHFRDLLIGEDPINVERLWDRMWVPKLVGRRGLTTRAISAIDIALWDLRAKVANMPLYRMLGGYRDSLPTYIAGGYYEDGKGLKELAEEMVAYVEAGSHAVKMKVGAVPTADDVARVRTVREAVGPDVKLLIDANCAYRAYEAIQLAERIQEYDVFWFEEPVAPDDYDGLRRLSAMTSIPVATGENEYTRYGFRDLIASKGVAILNPDAKVLGGVTEFMKVAALAQAHDLPIAPHGTQDIHVHLLAAIPNGLILEFYPKRFDPMWGRLYAHTITLNGDGTVSPPDLPGIGLEPNVEAIEQYRVA